MACTKRKTPFPHSHPHYAVHNERSVGSRLSQVFLSLSSGRRIATQHSITRSPSLYHRTGHRRPIRGAAP